MKKQILIILTVILSLTGAYAQQTEPNCVGYSAAIFANTVSELSENNQKLLINKVDQIIARNGAGKTAFYNAFSIVAEIAITDQQTAETGMANISFFKGELTLFAVNNIDKSRYGLTIVNLTGSGKSKELAIKNMLQSVKATDPVYAKFIKNATEKIIDYYNSNLGVVIKKTETLIAQEKYNEAMMVLQSIPECVPAYTQSSEAIKGLAEIVVAKSCESGLELAQRLYEIKEYEKAKEILMQIKPDSKCSEKTMELAKLLGSVETVVDKTDEEPALVVPPTTAAVIPTMTVDQEPVAPKVVAESGFKNVNFTFVSCVGNKNDQSIEIIITINHNLTNRKFATNKSSIYLPNGERINGSYPDEDVPTGVSVKFSYQFRGVLPSVTDIPMFTVTLNCYATNSTIDRQTVSFRNVPIKWM